MPNSSSRQLRYDTEKPTLTNSPNRDIKKPLFDTWDPCGCKKTFLAHWKTTQKTSENPWVFWSRKRPQKNPGVFWGRRRDTKRPTPKKKRNNQQPVLFPIFADPRSKKMRSLNYSARSPFTRDHSELSLTELQNGHVFTTCYRGHKFCQNYPNERSSSWRGGHMIMFQVKVLQVTLVTT